MINILSAMLLTLSSISQTDVEQLILDRAVAHAANPQEVLRVAICENRNLTPGLRNYSGSGAIGIFQWLRGRGNHWDRTPAWRDYRIDIHQEYNNFNPDALYYDVDMGAWSFGPEANSIYPGNKRGWSCY